MLLTNHIYVRSVSVYVSTSVFDIIRRHYDEMRTVQLLKTGDGLCYFDTLYSLASNNPIHLYRMNQAAEESQFDSRQGQEI
jgi:hypothetical protein